MPLPDRVDTQGLNVWIEGNHRDILKPRLRRQKAIERVAVFAGQQSGVAGVPRGYGEGDEALSFDDLVKAYGKDGYFLPFADPVLIRDFECRNGAYQYGVAGIGYCGRGPQRKARRIIEPPHQNMRIEEVSHLPSKEYLPSQACNSSSVNGARNRSSGSCPRRWASAPGLRGRLGAFSTGTSFTTGLLRRAMMISSPASARETRSDSSVFAWCIFIVAIDQI